MEQLFENCMENRIKSASMMKLLSSTKWGYELLTYFEDGGDVWTWPCESDANQLVYLFLRSRSTLCRVLKLPDLCRSVDYFCCVFLAYRLYPYSALHVFVRYCVSMWVLGKVMDHC